VWFAISIPVIAFGIYKLDKLVKEKREILPLLAVAVHLFSYFLHLNCLRLPEAVLTLQELA
jgi:cobalt/nickel transport system permease protein